MYILGFYGIERRSVHMLILQYKSSTVLQMSIEFIIVILKIDKKHPKNILPPVGLEPTFSLLLRAAGYRRLNGQDSSREK